MPWYPAWTLTNHSCCCPRCARCVQAMKKLGLNMAQAEIAETMEQALKVRSVAQQGTA